MDIWKQQSICFVKAKRSTLFKCHLPAATCNICFGTISIISKKKYLQGQKTIDTNYHRYSNLKSCETILNHAFFGDKLSDMNCKNSAKLKLAPLLILEKTICLRKYRKKKQSKFSYSPCCISAVQCLLRQFCSCCYFQLYLVQQQSMELVKVSKSI